MWSQRNSAGFGLGVILNQFYSHPLP